MNGVDLGLRGKTALVSGASAGVGLAIAKELAREGVRVVLAARTERRLQEAVDSITTEGGQATYTCADMSKRNDVEKAVATAVGAFGPPDIAIANVMPEVTYSFEETTDQQFARAHEQLVMSVVHLTRTTAPHMAQQGWGRIVNVGSVCMKEPHRWMNLALSNTFRAAQLGLGRTISNEYSAQGITFNSMALGSISTSLADSVQETQESRAMFEPPPRITSGRQGTPEEVAALCAFLCSVQAGYITGQVIAIDGGWTRGLI
jgi:3-oxoacyl-[acyl-carrier protein] reductase